ncbi:MAG: hypothetical protein AAFY99_13155 [Pseudomonadota bacterium]
MSVLRFLYERYRFRRWADFGWTCAGLVLGTACGYFPLYVQWNSESFSPPEMVYSRDREDGDAQLFAQYREPEFDRFSLLSLSRPTNLDEVTTGTVRPATANIPPPVFDSVERRVLSVHPGGFLIAGPDGIDFVPRNGIVAGSGRIDRIERRDGRIAIITTSGERIAHRGPNPQATDK